MAFDEGEKLSCHSQHHVIAHLGFALKLKPCSSIGSSTTCTCRRSRHGKNIMGFRMVSKADFATDRLRSDAASIQATRSATSEYLCLPVSNCTTNARTRSSQTTHSSTIMVRLADLRRASSCQLVWRIGRPISAGTAVEITLVLLRQLVMTKLRSGRVKCVRLLIVW
jgi:hypothetical protein